MVERHIEVPRLFDPFFVSNRVAAFEDLTSFQNTDFLMQPPYTAPKIAASLQGFLPAFLKSGDFDRLLEQYILKGGLVLKSRQFSIVLHEGKGKDDRYPFRYFYFDSVVNLVLTYNDVNKLACVTAGLEVKDGSSFSNEFNPGNISDYGLLINQLQGPTYYKEAFNIPDTFKFFRWERMLIEIFQIWGIEAGLKYLYVLPAAFNKWEKIKDKENLNGIQRYDKTAKKMGFERDSEEKPYQWENSITPGDLLTVLFGDANTR